MTVVHERTQIEMTIFELQLTSGVFLSLAHPKQYRGDGNSHVSPTCARMCRNIGLFAVYFELYEKRASHACWVVAQALRSLHLQPTLDQVVDVRNQLTAIIFSPLDTTQIVRALSSVCADKSSGASKDGGIEIGRERERQWERGRVWGRERVCVCPWGGSTDRRLHESIH